MSSAGQLVPPATRAPANMSTDPHGPQVHGALCSSIDYGYDPVISVVCAMYIAFGIVYTLFGYRCCKASMFLTGFTSAAAVVYLICLQEYLMPPYGNVGAALLGGLLFGLIALLVPWVGLFVTGLHTGLLLAVAGLAVYAHFLDARPAAHWPCTVALLCSGIFFAVINLYWKRALTVFGTSVYGGAVVAAALDYFVERMAMVQWVWARARLQPPAAGPCRASWAALAAWPCAAALGLAAQAAFGARPAPAKRRALAHAPALTREQRAQMRQRKYRYLYQVRTAHGDVISQSYVQALQKRAQCGQWSAGGGGGGGGAGAGGGECSTLQSDSTHLTVLGGGDLPPHADSDDDLHARAH